MVDEGEKKSEEEKTEEVKEKKVPHTCPSCGNEVGEEDRFCQWCGASLIDEEPKEKAEEIKQKEEGKRSEEKTPERKGWSTSKKVGVVVGSVAIVVVAVVITLYFLMPPSMTDRDRDGVLDYSDIYDYGNGKIYCNITYYNGDSSPDGMFGFTGELDPYFIIGFDTNGDGEFDASERYRSQTYFETDEIYKPFSKTIDIPDDTEYIRVMIQAWDSDGEDPPDIIDIVGDSGFYKWRIINYNARSGKVYHMVDKGQNDDVDDEIDAEIHFEIGITG